MPGKTQAPSLAESWSTSEDHLTHEFVLRPGVKFHDGEPVTAEDVKFSFERYHGTSHALLKEKVAAVEIAGSAARPVQAEGAVARFSDVLFERDRSRLDRAEEICRKGRRRGFQEQADRRRAVQIRVVQSRGRAGARSVRRLLAQDAERQAPGDEGDPRRGDARGGAEGRRGRHRLFDPRRNRRGDPADTRSDSEAGRAAGAELAVFPGAVGPEIAVEQIAGAAGGQSGDRPRGHEQGAVPRLLQGHQQRRRPVHVRLLLAAAGCGL